jgi:transposase-like protein
MSETMDPMATEMDQQELAQQLLAKAKEQGIDLVGPDGLLNRLTKNVLETALEAEMDEHLGYEKHDVAGRRSGNSRNGTRTKTVLTEIWELAVVQTCIVHLIRNTFRYAARQYWDELARDLRPVYTAPSEAAAKERFVDFSGKWAGSTRRLPGCGRTPGVNSCRSWTMTSKSGGLFAARTPSSPSMPATGARSGPGAISPPSRQP